ncbi:MAG: TadE/TadG family type IV pilus assembly protein [Minisyncoccia bacterium]
MLVVMHRRQSTIGRTRARGQALVEFALVAPIFFLLVFSVIQLGIMFGGQNGLVAATRELARYAAPFRVKTAVDAANVCADVRLTKQLNTFLQESIPGYVAGDVGTRTVTYSWLPNALPAGATQTWFVQMQVHVAYHFPMYVPIVGGILDDHLLPTNPSKQLDATETMRIENEDLTATYGTVSCSI